MFKTSYLLSKFQINEKNKLRKLKEEQEKRKQIEGFKRKYIEFRGFSLEKKIDLKMFEDRRVKSFEIKRIGVKRSGKLPLLSGRNSGKNYDFKEFEIENYLHDVVLVEKYLRWREKKLNLGKVEEEFGSSTMLPDDVG